MNTLAHLILIVWASCLAITQAAYCAHCGDPNARVSKPWLVYDVSNSRLGRTGQWSCQQIEDWALAGRFTTTQCESAWGITKRACGCTTGSSTTVSNSKCDLCSGQTVTKPSYLLDTQYGSYTCQELVVTMGRGGFMPSDMCSVLSASNGIAAQCGCTGGSNAPSFGFVACFSGENTVEIQGKGLVRMENVQIGDMAHVGQDKYSRVYSFGHRDTHARTEYLQIHTEGANSPLEITGDHMVFVEQRGAVPASVVSLGDKLLLGDESRTGSTVTKISSVQRNGAFAPFTESGALVVSGVVASSFISMEKDSQWITVAGHPTVSWQWIGYAFESPHRMICKVIDCGNESYTPEGISHWVHFPYLAVKWIMNQNALVMALIMIPVILLCGVLNIIELLTSNSTLALTIVLTFLVVLRKTRKSL